MSNYKELHDEILQCVLHMNLRGIGKLQKQLLEAEPDYCNGECKLCDRIKNFKVKGESND